MKEQLRTDLIRTQLECSSSPHYRTDLSQDACVALRRLRRSTLVHESPKCPQLSKIFGWHLRNRRLAKGYSSNNRLRVVLYKNESFLNITGQILVRRLCGSQSPTEVTHGAYESPECPL
jgi:hypothetical protein